MAGLYNLNIVDYNGETSSFGVETGAITAVSLAGTLSDIAELRTAISALIIGNQQSDSLRAFSTRISNNLPTSPHAQVERKWLVSYVDNTQFFDDPVNAIPNAGYGKSFFREIATADAELLEGNTEFLDLASVEADDFITAFEEIGRSPYGGRILVNSIQLVGRTR